MVPPIVTPTAAPMTVPLLLEDMDPAMGEAVADGGDAGDGRLEAVPLMEVITFERANKL